MDKERLQIYRALMNAFNPSVPAGGEGGIVYVDLEKVTGNRRILDHLLNTIMLNENPTCQVVSGLRGSGKSSLLSQLSLRASERGLSICSPRLDLSPICQGDLPPTMAEIMSFALMELVEWAERWAGKSNIHQGSLARIEQAASRFYELLGVAVNQVDVNAGFVKASIKSPSAIHEALLERSRQDPVALRRATQARFQEVISAILESTGHATMVLILDGLEKAIPTPLMDSEAVRLYYELQEPLYREPAMESFRLSCHTVVTAPPSLYLRGRLAGFDGMPQMITMVKVQNRMREAAVDGLHELTELVVKRHPHVVPVLFSDAASEDLRRLVVASGGFLRGLISMIRRGMEENLAMEEPIPTQVWDFVQSQQESQLVRQVFNNDLNLLVGLAPPVSNDDLHKGDWMEFEAARALIDLGLLLGYQNGEPWFDIHPQLRARVDQHALQIKQSMPSEDKPA